MLHPSLSNECATYIIKSDLTIEVHEEVQFQVQIRQPKLREAQPHPQCQILQSHTPVSVRGPSCEPRVTTDSSDLLEGRSSSGPKADPALQMTSEHQSASLETSVMWRGDVAERAAGLQIISQGGTRQQGYHPGAPLRQS